MNKKRIALALAAGLSINALVVTVGQVGGQGVVAHAIDVNNSQQMEQFKSIKVTSLNAAVKSVDSTTGEMILSIDKTGVTSAKGTLEGRAFGGTAITSTAQVSLNSDGTLKVTGINNPGVYTGSVELTVNGNTETYALTIKKVQEQQVLSLEGVDVGVGSINFTNATLGGKTITSGTFELSGNGLAAPSVINAKDKSFTVKDIKEGVYTVDYKDAAGNIKGSTQVVVTKSQNPVVQVVGSKTTNATTFIDDIAATVEKDFGLEAGSVKSETVLPTRAAASVTIKGKTDANTSFTVGTYNQTYKDLTGVKPGGAFGDATVSGSEVTVNLTKFSTDSANFVPANVVQNKANNNSLGGKKYIIGEQYVTVSGVKSTYYDENISGSKFEIKGTAVVNNKLVVTGGVENTGEKSINFPVKIDTSTFTHGYTPVSIDFTAQPKANVLVAGNNQANLDALLQANANQVEVVAADATVGTAATKTSVIVSKDELDGVSANATFRKTGDKTGILTVVNGVSLGANTLSTDMKVTNGTNAGTINSAKVVGNDVELEVTFANSVSGDIEWKHNNGLSGTVSPFGTEVLNFSGTVATENATNLKDQFYVTVNLDSVLPAGTTTNITLKAPNGDLIPVSNGKATLDITKLQTGSYTLEAEVKGGTQAGIYKAGFILSTQPLTVSITASDKKDGIAEVKVDANFFDSKIDKSKVKGQIAYRKVGETNFTFVDIAQANIKEEEITQNLALGAGDYEIKAVYTYTDANNKEQKVESTLVKVTVTGNVNNNTGGGIVSGGSGSTTTGTSVGSTTITSTSSNTTSDSDTVNITLPSGVNYDSNKTPVAVKFTYKGLDGKTVTETKEQYSNVTVKFENGKVVVDGLVPGKDYPEISVDYTDNNGRTRTLILKDVKTTATTDLEKYLADVYTTIFTRPADEAGYHFHLKNLGDKKTSLREFLLNLLTDKEFGENYKTPETKIDGLYKAIVARTAEQAGKDFWVNEYKKAVTTYGSEQLALKAIADRMVNEPELKTLAEKMNVQW